MKLHIDTKSDVPVYRQIMDQVCARVATGQLAVGERLPSVRDLAVELRLNPNTVARAYRELGQLGVVETQGGLGTVVRAGQGMPGGERREEEYRRIVREALRTAHGLGLSAARARQLAADEIDTLLSKGE